VVRKLIGLWILVVLTAACESGSTPRYEVIHTLDSPAPAAVSPSRSGVKHTIALVAKVAEIPYFKYAAEGALEAGRELGVEVLVDGPAVADADMQIGVVEKLIEKRVDLIAISANDPAKLVPVLAKAKRQGIRVVTWDADTESNAREFFVNMVEPETLGRHLMDTLAISMGERGKFAIMTGSLSAANINEWLKWIRVQHKEYYPEMELVEVAPTDDGLNKAETVARQLLDKHPDLRGILGNSSVGPPAAARAVKEAGKTGIIKVVGLSNPNIMSPYLRDGSAQVATLWSPKKLGYLTVVLAENLLNGVKPFDGQEIYNVGRIRMTGDMVIMGEPLDFTKENVDQYDF
jgi:rhamnose transport system substrate-binding protein